MYPGLFDDLADEFVTGLRGNQARRRDYRPIRKSQGLEHSPEIHVRSPWSHFIVFEIAPELFVPAQRAVSVASGLRAAVLSRIRDGVHPVIKGHEVDPPHVAYVPIPTVGHRKADGHLLGVALGVPHDEEVLAQLRRAFEERDGELFLTLDNVPGFREVRLVRRAGGSPWARRFDRFTGSAQEWRTVTPAVLDRAPSKRLSEEDADLVFYRDHQPVYVGDAKYKLTRDLTGRDSDLYQLLAYATALGVREGVLIHGLTDGTDEGVGEIKVGRVDKRLAVKRIDLRGGRQDIGEAVSRLATWLTERTSPPNDTRPPPV